MSLLLILAFIAVVSMVLAALQDVVVDFYDDRPGEVVFGLLFALGHGVAAAVVCLYLGSLWGLL